MNKTGLEFRCTEEILNIFTAFSLTRHQVSPEEDPWGIEHLTYPGACFVRHMDMPVINIKDYCPLGKQSNPLNR